MRAQGEFLDSVPSRGVDSMLNLQLYQGAAESQRTGGTASISTLNGPFIYTIHDNAPEQMDISPLGPGKPPRP